MIAATAVLTACGSDATDRSTASGPACGLISPKLAAEAVPDLPDKMSDGVGLERDGDSISVDPDDAQGAQCIQSSATDPGSSLDIRITEPGKEQLARLRAEAADTSDAKATCEPLQDADALGSTCLVDGPGEDVVRAYTVWKTRVITVSLARSEGAQDADRALVASIAASVDDRLS